MNRPIMESAPSRSAGRPETVVPNATSARPVSRARAIPQAAWWTVAVVSRRAAANAPSAAPVGAESRRSSWTGGSGTTAPAAAGARRVGAVSGASASRQALVAAGRSWAASQARKSR
ncbi:hypothetical protein M2436_007199 [Streptomyces sp. HB372]|nr:hypothetical protein [Streptomyces sp. HB372]